MGILSVFVMGIVFGWVFLFMIDTWYDLWKTRKKDED